MKKLLFILLALPTLSAFAASPCAYDTVAQIAPCKAGREFTIKIPVRLPSGIFAEYLWQRNGVAILGTQGATGIGGGMIAYTIPAASAYGENQKFSFLFRMSDDSCADCWDTSPLYEISWNDNFEDFGCATSGGEIAGDVLYLCGANAGGEIDGEAVQVCSADAGGEVDGEAVEVCNANAGGEIDGEAVEYCSANAGGEIGGEAVQVCGAGAGGVIGSE